MTRARCYLIPAFRIALHWYRKPLGRGSARLSQPPDYGDEAADSSRTGFTTQGLEVAGSGDRRGNPASGDTCTGAS